MSTVGLPGFAVHPGEILDEEFRKPMGLTQEQLADTLETTYQTVNAICCKRRSVTADMALRLAKAFGTTAEFWMNMQTLYDLVKAKENGKSTLTKIKRIRVRIGKDGQCHVVGARAKKSQKTTKKEHA